MMDHDLVIKNNTTERYLLGELTDAERDSFEEHYFECPACAEDLRCGDEFIQHAIDEFRTGETSVPEPVVSPVPPVPAGRPIWMKLVPMGAFAVVLVALCVSGPQIFRAVHGPQPQIAAGSQSPQPQSIANAKLPQPAVGSPLYISLKFARGGNGLREQKTPKSEVKILGKNQPVQFNIDVSELIRRQGFASYQAVIFANDGREIRTHNFSPEQAAGIVEWRLFAGELTSGSYSVTIRAFDVHGTKQKIEGNVPRIAFNLQMQDR